MKKINLYIAGTAIMLLAGACAEEKFDMAGEGSLALKTSVNTDMTVVSRATDAELAQNCMVWISNSQGLVRRYNAGEELPSRIPLHTGHYVDEGWPGDSVPASWDKRWFKGMSEFDIAKGQTAQVELTCKIANTAVTVDYQEGIEEVLTDYTLTVGHSGGSLIFDGRDTRRGYFMMSSKDKNLTYELKGTAIGGKDFSFSGVIENAAPATEYALHVTYTPKEQSIGGAYFTITVDEHEITVNEQVVIIPAPRFSGYDFDIDNAITAEKGLVGRRTVYVTSPTKITGLKLTSDLFTSISTLGGYNDFDILAMSADGLAGINAAGINHTYSYDEEADATVIQLNFEETFTNILDNGDYSILLEATDKNGKKNTATVHILISDAPVVTADASAVSYFSATLCGTVSKDGVMAAGFNYRMKGASEWIHVDATGSFEKGSQYTVVLSDLRDGTIYEYAATTPEFTSLIVKEFSTLSAQLPNASFEVWGMEGSSQILANDYNSIFWDSGNHGATTIGSSWNLTTPSTDYVHSGTYSARLESKKVIVKFAAGNLFAGKYLDTKGTNGVLGFGRPFTLSPKSMKVWVKYTPKAVDNTKGIKIDKGEMDQGIIYIALLDETTESYNGQSWPVTIDTSVPKLFDSNGSNVIAYGERVFTEATTGDGLIQIEIPLDYKRQGVTPSNILIVASASRYGDYFEGAAGSVMYLDDIELTY